MKRHSPTTAILLAIIASSVLVTGSFAATPGESKSASVTGDSSTFTIHRVSFGAVKSLVPPRPGSFVTASRAATEAGLAALSDPVGEHGSSSSAEAARLRQSQAHDENERIRQQLEPYVLVTSTPVARFELAAAAMKSGVHPHILREVHRHLEMLNRLADAGEIDIQPDRSVLVREIPGGADALSTTACGNTLTTHWWGMYITMNDSFIHGILSRSDCGSVRDYIRRYLAGPTGTYISQLSYLYCQVLRGNLWLFDNWICHHSCQSATVYWWALPTPFLNCL